MNSGKIGQFPAFRARIVSPSLQAVADYWQLLRGTEAMPAWADLSPSHLAPHLKLMWFFNYNSTTGEFAARLASNRAMRGFHKSFRGTPLKELHPPHIYQLSQAHMTKLVSDPAAYYCSGHLFKVGSQAFEGERIMLPLGSDRLRGDGVLGATDFPMRPADGEVELLVGQIEWFAL